MVSTITGTVVKSSKDVSVGIGFAQKDESSPLMIKLVRDDGLFAATDLVPGLEALEVNGQDVVGKSAKEAANLLRSADGEVSVVAKGIVSKATKEQKTTPVGISIRKDPMSGSIYISAITENSLFVGTDLKVGQLVIAINRIPCPETLQDAIAIVREAEGALTIVSVDPHMDETQEHAPVSKETDVVEQEPRSVPSAEGEEIKPEKKDGWLASLFSMCFY